MYTWKESCGNGVARKLLITFLFENGFYHAFGSSLLAILMCVVCRLWLSCEEFSRINNIQFY